MMVSDLENYFMDECCLLLIFVFKETWHLMDVIPFNSYEKEKGNNVLFIGFFHHKKENISHIQCSFHQLTSVGAKVNDVHYSLERQPSETIWGVHFGLF